MKKQIALAMAFAAALCAAPFSACGEEKEPAGQPFQMADYAEELPDRMTAESYFQTAPAFASVKRLDGLALQGFDDYRQYGGNYQVAQETGTDENDGLFRLYGLKEDKAISDWYDQIDTDRVAPFLLLRKEAQGIDGSYSSTVFQFATPTGKVFPAEPLSEQTSYYDSFSDYYYPNGSATQVRWYGISCFTADGPGETVYISVENGEWKELTEADIGQASSDSSHSIGDSLGMLKTPLADPDIYPNYIYKDYSYTVEGRRSAYRYTFYQGENKHGSVTVFGSMKLGIIGKYLYYYEAEAVSADAKKGYNVEVTESSSAQKANMTLCRYDFTKNETEKVSSGYFFSPSGSSSSLIDGSALYNRRTNDFDRLEVTASKKTNGVAILSNITPTYQFIIDDEAHVSLDLTAKSISSSFYRLNEERFLSDTSILDKNMDIVAQLPSYSFSPKVWKEQSLIFVSASYSDCFAVDYDGKVTIAGIGDFNNCFLSGESLFAKGKDGDMLIFSKAAPTGKTLNEAIGAGEDSRVTSLLSGILYTYEGETYTFYNFGGKKIGEFTGFNVEPSYLLYDGKCYVSAYGESGPVTLLFQA